MPARMITTETMVNFAQPRKRLVRALMLGVVHGRMTARSVNPHIVSPFITAVYMAFALTQRRRPFKDHQGRPQFDWHTVCQRSNPVHQPALTDSKPTGLNLGPMQCD